MKRHLLIFIVLLNIFTSSLFGQKSNFYLEDQIFFSITYNMLINKSDSIKQGGFSNGLNIGYMRDIPFNERRNFGVGVGINYSIGHYYQNISIKTFEDGTTEFQRLESKDYIRNKFSLSFLEIPFEIRYRTSTIDKDKFFRAYLGFKIGYRLRAYSKLKTQTTEIAYYNQPEFNWWRYGLTLNVGYSTWNFHMYYSLSKVFKDNTSAKPVVPENTAIPMDMNELSFGLTFYLI
jgi:hypothetical protein